MGLDGGRCARLPRPRSTALASCDREYPSSRRAYAFGRAVAGARSCAPGHADLDRRQSPAAIHAGAAAERAEFLLRRYSEFRMSSASTPSSSNMAAPAELTEVPMLRGRILRVKDVPADQVKVDPEQAWVLQSDRGITFTETFPEGSTLVSPDEWWPKDYAGSAAGFVREARGGWPWPESRRQGFGERARAARSKRRLPICARWNGRASASIS
jgi:hypothetical protein